jgi:hypothetical protein
LRRTSMRQVPQASMRSTASLVQSLSELPFCRDTGSSRRHAGIVALRGTEYTCAEWTGNGKRASVSACSRRRHAGVIADIVLDIKDG